VCSPCCCEGIMEVVRHICICTDRVTATGGKGSRRCCGTRPCSCRLLRGPTLNMTGRDRGEESCCEEREVFEHRHFRCNQ
jgi:hypothetical protein